MADVRNLDFIPHAIEDLVGVTNEEQHSYFRIVGLIRSADAREVALRHRRYLLRHFGLRQANALANIQESARGLQMLAGCNEPSSLVAFVGFRHDFVRYASARPLATAARSSSDMV